MKMIKSNKNYKGEIFNVGSGRQYSIGEAIIIAKKLLGKKLNIDATPTIFLNGRRSQGSWNELRDEVKRIIEE